MTKNIIHKDLKYVIGSSGVVIITLVGIMFFSPLASQFTDEGIRSGSLWEVEVDEYLSTDRAEMALELVDSIIAVKEQNLPRFAYFDRYLSENERMDVANARADVYDLQWKRIEILNKMKRTNELREALEDYVKLTGYNQTSANIMLKQLNDK